MLSERQTLKACRALLAHVHKQERKSNATQLLTQPDTIGLVVATKRIPEAAKVKPERIPLRHSIFTESSVCLIVKDTDKERMEELRESGLGAVTKVLSLTDLRTEYKPFEAKRQLCSEFDLFLADDRIVRFLPKVLGKAFFVRKKIPAPVNISKKGVKEELESACHSTYLRLSSGSCMTVKIGTSAMTPEQIAENIEHGMKPIVRRVAKQWKNIQSVSIKSSNSIALPIFNSIPDDPAHILVEDRAAASAG